MIHPRGKKRKKEMVVRLTDYGGFELRERQILALL